MRTIFRKELADYFTSIRCFILLLLVFLVSALALHAAYAGIRGADLPTGFIFLGLFITPEKAIPALLNFPTIIALFFIPLIGITLGFDAINTERSSGNLSRILAQPVFRDNIINGKFLAGIVILSIMMAATMLIVSGYGLRIIGVPPTAEEIIRLFVYLVFAIINGAFWMGLAILFSVLFRSIATSLLSSLAIWLFFGIFYILMIVPAVAKTAEMYQMLMRFSPNYLFLEATTVLLYPVRLITGAVFTPTPLSFSQSLLLVWPQLTALIGLTIICFAISYVAFMRQEIRAT